MITVTVKNGNVDAALKRFKQKVAKSGLPSEIKKKQAFDNEIQKKKLQELELGGDHSSEECANNLISEIEYRKNYSLTLEARKRMDEVRKKHDEENKKDIELCKLVLQYDKHKDLRTKEIEKERLNKKNRLRGIADDSTLNR